MQTEMCEGRDGSKPQVHTCRKDRLVNGRPKSPSSLLRADNLESTIKFDQMAAWKMNFLKLIL